MLVKFAIAPEAMSDATTAAHTKRVLDKWQRLRHSSLPSLGRHSADSEPRQEIEPQGSTAMGCRLGEGTERGQNHLPVAAAW